MLIIRNLNGTERQKFYFIFSRPGFTETKLQPYVSIIRVACIKVLITTSQRPKLSHIPLPDCLLLGDLVDVDIAEGGIDLDIIVTGSSSEGNENVEGRGSGELSLCE